MIGVTNFPPDWACLKSSFEFICKAGAFANLDANLWTKFKCVELVTVFPLTLAFIVCRNSSLSNDDKCMIGLLLQMLAVLFLSPLITTRSVLYVRPFWDQASKCSYIVTSCSLRQEIDLV